MKKYEQEFCKNIINDEDVSDEYLDIFNEMMQKEYNMNEILNFVKDSLDISISSISTEHLDKLVYNIGGDYEEFAELADIDLNDIDDIDDKKTIWENSDFSDEIQERVDELIAEKVSEDEDW